MVEDIAQSMLNGFIDPDYNYDVIWYDKNDIYDDIWYDTGLIRGLCPANERRRYKITPSLIGYTQT